MKSDDLLSLAFPTEPPVKATIISRTFDPRKSNAGTVMRLAYRSFFARPLWVIDGKPRRVRSYSTEFDTKANAFAVILDGERLALSSIEMTRRESGRVLIDCRTRG